MRSLTRVLGACVLAVTVTTTGLAFGGDTSTAEHLFRQGLDLLKANKFKEACDAFAGSNEVDPSPGTEINLALCNEKQGKFASAWGWYRTAAGLADQRGQRERADLARAEAVKLEPKLHKLNVSAKAPVEGMAVTRNGQPMPAATLGTDVPIDPGDYTIEVTAKGKQPWKQSIKIAVGPSTDRIEISLVDAPVEAVAPVPGPASADYVPPPPGRDGSTQRIIGFSLGGAGIAAGVVALIFEVVALSEDKKRVAEEKLVVQPGDVGGHQASADSHRKTAKVDETAALALGIGGGILLVGGLVLVLTAPSSKSSAALIRPQLIPMLSRETAGLGLVGRF